AGLALPIVSPRASGPDARRTPMAAIRACAPRSSAGHRTRRVRKGGARMIATRTVVSLSLLAFLATGCVSKPLKIETRTGSNYEELGEGQGSATGIMLFNFIPIGQNERFVRAYEAAVKSKGGDALLNPEISERWFWAYVVSLYRTTVRGTVIRYK